jgi:hypothetical protein
MFRSGRQKVRPSRLCLMLLTSGTRGRFTEHMYLIAESTVSSQCRLRLSGQLSCSLQLQHVLPLYCTDSQLASWFPGRLSFAKDQSGENGVARVQYCGVSPTFVMELIRERRVFRHPAFTPFRRDRWSFSARPHKCASTAEILRISGGHCCRFPSGF